MVKRLALLHVGVVFVYCRFLAPTAGGDVPIYAWSLALALLTLRTHALLSKGFAFNAIFLIGITTWLCHFLLAPELQIVTARLRHVKGMLLVLFLALEIVAAAHLARRYLAARRSGAFAGEAFAHALAPYPLLPAMLKLFLVEFNIWRALLLRLSLLTERDGAGMRRVAAIDAGYRRRMVCAACALAVTVNLLCAWLLPPLWLLASGLTTLYLALLLNGELLQFAHHAIYDDGIRWRIPNGIYGFLAIDKDNIAEVTIEAPGAQADLVVARLLPANVHVRLHAPLTVDGKSVATVGLRLPREQHAALREALQPAIARPFPA